MRPTPYDAWTLRRLLCGDALNGELGTVSEPFRAFLDLLAATPPEGRQARLDGFLAGQANPEAINQTLREADPNGPPPDQSSVQAAAPDRPRARITCLADVEPKPVEWLWRGRVPLGVLSLWSGDPKLGKSLATIAVAAAVSRGAPLPGESHSIGPASVLIMSAEDDPARTIRPRLDAAGADLRRVHALESIIRPGRKGEPDADHWPSLLAHDLPTIEDAAAGVTDCKLIVIDPVSAYLEGVDDHRNVELRGVLSPLTAMAERLKAAVVLVSHLSKSSASNGKYRAIGSISYVASCRANSLFVRDHSDPTGRRVLMCDNGGNLAPTAPTLGYIVEDRGDGARLEWVNEAIDITADQALAAEQGAQMADRDAPERREAAQWLREVLSTGPVLATEIRELVKSCPFSLRTVETAKKSLAIKAYREGFGRDGQWYWRLDDAPSH